MIIRPATGIPEGTSGEGGAQLAGRVLDRDAALHRARHMDPQASSTRDQHAAGWIGGAERRSAERELSQRSGGKLDSDYLCLS
jgi:hypothetical protein